MTLLIVTGAGRGLGRAFAEEGNDLGFEVVGLSKSACPAEWKGEIAFIQADLANDEQASRAFSQISKVDDSGAVLINNAGRYIEGGLDSSPAAEALLQFEMNFVSFLNSTRAFVNRWPRGQVVNMCGYNALHPTSNSLLYGSVKLAISRASESLRAEFAERGLPIGVLDIFASSINTWSDEVEPGTMDKNKFSRFILRILRDEPDLLLEQIVIRARD